MASTKPGPDAAVIDWEAAYYHLGLAASGSMETAAELEHLATLYPALSADPHYAAYLRTAQRLRDNLQTVCKAVAYPRAEESRATRELAWRQALGGAA